MYVYVYIIYIYTYMYIHIYIYIYIYHSCARAAGYDKGLRHLREAAFGASVIDLVIIYAT